jgi:hypothetical protein
MSYGGERGGINTVKQDRHGTKKRQGTKSLINVGAALYVSSRSGVQGFRPKTQT